MPRPGERIGKHSTNLPHRLTILCLTGAVRTQILGIRARPITIFPSKQRLSFSFNYFPTTTSYVPADPLFPNDATAYEQGKTDNLTGQISHVYTISPTMLNEFRVGASRELDKYTPPSLGKNDPTTLGLEPAYGTQCSGQCVSPYRVLIKERALDE